MKANVGNVDRAVRVIIGLALLSQMLTGAHAVWGWMAIIPLATAAIGFCPLYRLVGMSTCPSPQK